MYVTGGWFFKSNRTTSVPKSVPRLVLDKVRGSYSNVYVQLVPNKHLIDGMDVTILTTSLRPIFTVTLV